MLAVTSSPLSFTVSSLNGSLYKDERPGRGFFLALASVGVAICGLSLAGNSVLVGFYAHRKRRKQCFFLAALAAGELFKTLTGLWMFSVNAFYGGWYFGKLGCQYYGFTMTWCSLLTIMLYAAIACEKGVVISCPLYQTGIAMRLKVLVAVALIAFCILLSALPFVGWGKYVPDGFKLSCMFDYTSPALNDRSYTALLLITCFLVPLSVILVSYSKIVREARQSRMRLQSCHDITPLPKDYETCSPTPPRLTMTRTGRLKKQASLPEAELARTLKRHTVADDGRVRPCVERGESHRLLRMGTKSSLTSSTYYNCRQRTQELKLATSVLTAIVAFLAAWLPYTLMAFAALFGYPHAFGPYGAAAAEVCAKSSVILNPLVLVWRDTRLTQYVWGKTRFLLSCGQFDSSRTERTSALAHFSSLQTSLEPVP